MKAMDSGFLLSLHSFLSGFIAFRWCNFASSCWESRPGLFRGSSGWSCLVFVLLGVAWPICCRCSLQLRKFPQRLSAPNQPETRGKRSLHLHTEYSPPALSDGWVESEPVLMDQHRDSGNIPISGKQLWVNEGCGLPMGKGGCRMDPWLEKIEAEQWIWGAQCLCSVAVSPASLPECQKGALRQEHNRKTITFPVTGCPIIHDLLLSVLNVKRGKWECFRTSPK